MVIGVELRQSMPSPLRSLKGPTYTCTCDFSGNTHFHAQSLDPFDIYRRFSRQDCRDLRLFEPIPGPFAFYNNRTFKLQNNFSLEKKMSYTVWTYIKVVVMYLSGEVFIWLPWTASDLRERVVNRQRLYLILLTIRITLFLKDVPGYLTYTVFWSQLLCYAF